MTAVDTELQKKLFHQLLPVFREALEKHNPADVIVTITSACVAYVGVLSQPSGRLIALEAFAVLTQKWVNIGKLSEFELQDQSTSQSTSEIL